MKARSSRIRIRGAWWKIKHCRPPGKEALDGLCDYEARTIYVNPKAIEQQGTLIHEVLHAAFPDIEEQAVAETEEAIVGALAIQAKGVRK